MDADVLARVGHLDQVAGVRRYRLEEGPGKGLSLVGVHNRRGLEYTVLPDRGLDLYDLRYRGVNLAFHTKNGLMARPAPETGDQFFSQWGGGALVTCGLANVGLDCETGEFHPVHGRIGWTAASAVSTDERWDGDDLVLEVGGQLHETRLYGRHLMLRRSIRTRLDSASVVVEDEVANLAAADEPVLLLYHLNFGHPLAAPGCWVATNNAEQVDRVLGEVEDRPSTTTEHRGGPTDAAAVLWNPELGLGVGVRWSREALPYLHLWHDPAPGGYVLAIEPATCPTSGRVDALAQGGRVLLAPYTTARFRVEITVLEPADLDDFCRSTGIVRRPEAEAS